MKMITTLILPLCSVSIAFADVKTAMNFNNEELGKVVEQYSKVSGQKFIIDPGVRGKITILLPEPVSTEEAFNHLSTALAVNGYAISKQGDTMVIKSARNIQRDLIEVSTQRPTLKPERMYSWIYRGKNVSVTEISTELRILNSRDGEVAPFSRTNQLIITDWVSNINRIADLLTEIDKPIDVNTAKIVESERKSREFKIRKQSQLLKKEDTKPTEPKTE
jgi:general secretion pathway protein D